MPEGAFRWKGVLNSCSKGSKGHFLVVVNHLIVVKLTFRCSGDTTVTKGMYEQFGLLDKKKNRIMGEIFRSLKGAVSKYIGGIPGCFFFNSVGWMGGRHSYSAIYPLHVVSPSPPTPHVIEFWTWWASSAGYVEDPSLLGGGDCSWLEGW